jgi:hypothetical protein
MDSINPVAASGHRSDTNETSQPPSTGPWPDYDTHLISQAQRAQQIDPSDARTTPAMEETTAPCRQPRPHPMSRSVRRARFKSRRSESVSLATAPRRDV